MKYLVERSEINVVGYIWQPGIGPCATTIRVDYQVTDMRDEDGRITRDSVQSWLDTHAGDFSEIIDFRASVECDGETVDIDWSDEGNEMTFNDCMFGQED